MKGKDLLGSISPAYGMITGKGAFGDMRGGALGALANLGKGKKKKPVSEEVASDVASSGVSKFKKGGRVKSCADGCAIRGKTRGMMKSYK